VKSLFCDTSFFCALLDSRDRDHATAKGLAEGIQRGDVSLITTWEVVMETIPLLRYRYSYRGALTFIEHLLPRLNVVYIDEQARAKALAVFKRWSRDSKISLCDAVSYVVVSKWLDFIPCLAFDDDFRRMGLTKADELP